MKGVWDHANYAAYFQPVEEVCREEAGDELLETGIGQEDCLAPNQLRNPGNACFFDARGHGRDHFGSPDRIG
jgi:hypothetical protein